MQLALDQRIQPEEARSAWKEELMMQYLPQVKRIVNRLAAHLPPNTDLEDLYNVGVIGLIQAVDRYDPDRDNTFITYSTHRIRGEVLSELRSQDYLSRSSRRKVRTYDRAYAKLERKLGRDVHDNEVADELSIDMKELDEIKRLSSISFVSFEELGLTDSNDKSKMMKYLVDGDMDALSHASFSQLREVLGRAIDDLPKKDQMVLSLYYFEDMTMKEIGNVLGISESRVSQIHSRALIHLRRKLPKEDVLIN